MIVLEEKNIDRVVFHFNKASLSDLTLPFWVVKFKGITHYADEVISSIGFSTKNTPDNTHTKGSILLRKVDLLVKKEGDKKVFYINAHEA